MARTKLTIVNVDGLVVEDADTLRQFIKDFAAIDGAKLLVHGEGSMASNHAERCKISIKTNADNKEIIDDRVIDLVAMIYGGLVNKRLVAILQWQGVNAVGLTGADLNIATAVKMPAKPVNYGWTGTVRKINSVILAELLKKGIVPVIAPLTHDGKGHLLNNDNTELACEIARALTIQHEISVIHVAASRNGILTNEHDPDSVIPALQRTRYKNMKEMGLIAESMTPDVDLAFSTIDHGAKEVTFISAARFGDTKKGTHIQ